MMRKLINQPALFTATRRNLLLLKSNPTKAVQLNRKSKLVRAWFVADAGTSVDQRDPRLPNPPTYLSMEEVNKRTGVKHHKFNSETHETNPEFLELKKKMALNYEDMLEISKETLPDYDEKIKRFYKEHIHADDEIRLCLAGSGYFDVRDTEDKWVRVEMSKDDLLIIPAGIYHRFTLDSKDYIKLKRMFSGVPVWTAFDRPADNHPVRIAYVKQMTNART